MTRSRKPGVISAFEVANNIKVTFVKGGDTGATLNRLILESLSGSTPSADVFFGLDNTFLSRALEQDLLEPYDAPQLAQIPQSLSSTPRTVLCLWTTVTSALITTKPGSSKTRCLSPPPWLNWLTLATPTCWSSRILPPPPRAGFHAGDHCRIWRGWLAGLVAIDEKQRSPDHIRLGNRLLYQLFRLIRQRRATNGGFLRLQPRGGVHLRGD
jgi:hypothetical protein